MNELAVLHREIDTLPQNRVGEVLDFVGYLKQQEAQEDLDEPNEETIAAIEEGRAMRRGEIPCKRYKSVDEFWADLEL
ncbi:hypothetical protein AGMMS50268_17830 [Spirochaetia bacterium]|nr:hypothetical protein AGMMS50268_17830 [Spirochaetia bacterium]